MHRPRRVAMTLIELLIVVAIIVLLLALLLPAIQAARESSRATTCQGNLKQIGTAVLHHASVSGGRLPASWRTVRDRKGKDAAEAPIGFNESSFSWRATILPHLEQKPLYDQIDFKSTPLAASNRALVSTVVALYQCPTTPDCPRTFQALADKDVDFGATDYSHVFFIGIDEARADRIGSIHSLAGAWYGSPKFEHDKGGGKVTYGSDKRKAREAAPVQWITDGLSRTIVVAEKAGFPALLRPEGFDSTEDTWSDGAWAAGEFGGFGKAKVNWSNFPSIFSFHPSGAHVAMCDGSVKFLEIDTGLDVVVALCSRDGDEVNAP